MNYLLSFINSIQLKPFSNVWLIVLLSFSILSCNKNKIPNEVKQSFEELYPDTDADWTHENEDTWYATFEWNNQEWNAYFGKEGEWFHSKQKLLSHRVPSKVKSYIHLFYPRQDFDFCILKTQDAECILAEILNDSLKIAIYFDQKGYVVKDEFNLSFNNLREKYLTASNITWNKSGNYHVANFLVDEKPYRSYFNTDGSIFYSEAMIPLYETPSKVAQSIKRLSGFELEQITKKLKNGHEIFHITGKTNEVKKELYFDLEGKEMEAEEINLFFNPNPSSPSQ